MCGQRVVVHSLPIRPGSSDAERVRVGPVRELGPFTRSQLAEQGIDRGELRELVASGRLRKVKRGWFADPFTPDDAIRALELGGRLGCLSACRAHGLWTPPQTDLHVMLNPGAPVPTLPPPGVRFHRLVAACSTAVASVDASIGHVLHRHDIETGLVVLESGVNSGLVHEADARQLLSTVPLREPRKAHHFSPLAQSGSETRLRLFFQGLGVPVRPQAFIAGVGHVDLLVGRSWIVEADSAAHHSAPRDVAVDCDRDLVARELGYARDRLSYEQIWLTWDRTKASLAATVRTRRHLVPPRSLQIGA